MIAVPDLDCAGICVVAERSGPVGALTIEGANPTMVVGSSPADVAQWGSGIGASGVISCVRALGTLGTLGTLATSGGDVISGAWVASVTPSRERPQFWQNF